MSDKTDFKCLFVMARYGALPKDFSQWGICDESGWTVSHVCAMYGTLPSDFTRWNVCDAGGLTVAHVAAQHGYLPPDFDQWDICDDDGWSVAHLAAANDKLPIDFHKARPDIWKLKDRLGRSVETVAIENGYVVGSIDLLRRHINISKYWIDWNKALEKTHSDVDPHSSKTLDEPPQQCKEHPKLHTELEWVYEDLYVVTADIPIKGTVGFISETDGEIVELFIPFTDKGIRFIVRTDQVIKAPDTLALRVVINGIRLMDGELVKNVLEKIGMKTVVTGCHPKEMSLTEVFPTI